MGKDIWEGRDSHVGLYQHSPILESKQAHGLTEVQSVETGSALHSPANPAPHALDGHFPQQDSPLARLPKPCPRYLVLTWPRPLPQLLFL